MRTRTYTDERPGNGGASQLSEVGSMQQALQAALSRIRADVESLAGAQQKDSDGEAEEVVTAAEAKRAAQQAEMELQAARRSKEPRSKRGNKETQAKVEVIMSRPRKKLVVDKPQELSDDTDDEASDFQPSDDSKSAQTSENPSDVEFDGAEAVLAHRRRSEDEQDEDWNPGASVLLQELLRSINLEERTEMLEDLDCYYSRKQRQLEDDDRRLSGIEDDLFDANFRLDKESADVKHNIDVHEASLYKALRHYDMCLRGLASAPPELPQRLEEIKAGLIKTQGIDCEDLKAGSGEVLAVVTKVQEYLDSLQSCVELQEGRLNAYQHAEKVLTDSAQIASDAPLHDEVVSHVIKEVVKVRGSSASLDSDSPVDEDVFEHCARLTRECDDLRTQIASERERDGLLQGGGNSNAKSLSQRGLWRRKLLRKSTANMTMATRTLEKEQPPWDSHALFDWEAQQQYEAELARLQAACDHAEQLIHSFQEIQVFSAGSVAPLEEGVRKLTEVSQYAKKNITIGCLPDEEDKEEALVRDLREANHEITLKQEAEHNSQMLKLEALEGKILQDVRAADEKVRMLEWALNREDDKCGSMDKEIRSRKGKQTEAREKFESLPPLPIKVHEAERELALEKQRKLQEQHEVAHERMLIAMRKAEATVKMFKQAQSVGNDIASNASWKQLETGVSIEATAKATSEWWHLVSEIDHEDPLEMEHVDQMLAVLRQEETGAPTALFRDRTSTENLQRPKFAEDDTSERLAALIAAANEAEAHRPGNEGGGKDSSTRHRRKMKGGKTMTKDWAKVAKEAGRHRSRPKHSRSGTREQVVPKLMQARQRARTNELLLEAKQDQEEAQMLEARTEELCRASAALEAKALQFLSLRGTKELPAELKVSFRLDDLPMEDTQDSKLARLREEARQHQMEFDMLAAKMRDVRKIARRGSTSIIKSGKITEDLRSEVIQICEAALESRRGSTAESRRGSAAGSAHPPAPPGGQHDGGPGSADLPATAADTVS